MYLTNAMIAIATSFSTDFLLIVVERVAREITNAILQFGGWGWSLIPGGSLQHSVGGLGW